MADTKLSALTELAVEPADTDEIYVNDGGTSKRVQYSTVKDVLVARANHTGTQAASTISDFDTEVSNNSDVTANTAKVTNATHTGDATGSGALTLQAAAITGKGAVTVAGSDLLLVADVSASPQALGQVTAQSVANLFDASSYLPLSGGELTGDITFAAASPEHTVDGRNVSVDGAKLDTIEENADVTDTANVTAAGALMDSEITNLAQVKAFDSSDYATAAQGSTADSALQDVVDDTTPQLGGALDGQGHDLNNLGVVFLTEQAAAEADVAGKGQHWVKTATPNRPMFTDDAGTDFEVLEVIFSAHVETVADQEYVITYDAPFAGAITVARTKTESGTCTVTGEIDDSNLGGTANSASTSAQEQTHSSSNTYAKGAKIAFTVSSNSSATDLEVTLYGVRTA